METLTLRDFHISLEVLKLIGHYNKFDKRKLTNISKTTDNQGNITYTIELSQNYQNSINKSIYNITVYKEKINCIINNQMNYVIKKNPHNNNITISFQDYPLNTINLESLKDFRKNYIKKKKRLY